MFAKAFDVFGLFSNSDRIPSWVTYLAEHAETDGCDGISDEEACAFFETLNPNGGLIKRSEIQGYFDAQAKTAQDRIDQALSESYAYRSRCPDPMDHRTINAYTRDIIDEMTKVFTESWDAERSLREDTDLDNGSFWRRHSLSEDQLKDWMQQSSGQYDWQAVLKTRHSH